MNDDTSSTARSIDPHRPAYHFTSQNWMNDPIPFYDAQSDAYHVFYQHNPAAPDWGNMHWGHAVSRDLTTWETLPIALAPGGPGEPDAHGVWTGSVTRRALDGKYCAFYTGIPVRHPLMQVHCLATSDDLTTWTKHGEIDLPKPPGFGECFRDPQNFDGPDGARYIVIGGEQENKQGGAAFLYRAEDDTLTRWRYLHPLLLGDPSTGHDFECPDFFPFANADDDASETTWLFLSSRGKTWWRAGWLTGQMRFETKAQGACDAAGWESGRSGFYAGKTLRDKTGRRILFGWITEDDRPQAERNKAGWSGVLSLPRIVTMGADGAPRFRVPPEVSRALRGSPDAAPVFHIGGALVEPTTDRTRHLLKANVPNTLEITATLTPKVEGTGRFGLYLDYGADMRLDIVYDAQAQTLEGADASLTLAPDEPLTLHIFCDPFVIEIFAGEGRVCWTRRVFPTEATGEFSLGLVADGVAVVADVSAWALHR